MKTTFIVLATLCLIFFACENATNPLEPTTNLQPAMARQIDNEGPSLARAAKVDVCHLNANGEYIVINISENAYQAHLDHGDIMYGWHVGETWVLDWLSGPATREFRNLVQDAVGNLTGEFWHLAGTWQYGGTLEGYVNGDELYLYYERPFPLTYTGEFWGVIGENEITGGTFLDNKNYSDPEHPILWTATGQTAFGCE